MKMKILLVDNDTDFLSTRKEVLEKAGHRVFAAGSLEEARQILFSTYLHLVILDIRMVNDDDEYDKSGLALAEEPELEHIPKIIFTNWPEYADVKKVLIANYDREPYAVDYIDKKDGADAMVKAVEKAWKNHININENLTLLWDNEETINSLGLIGSLEKDLPHEQQLTRVEEIEDLFRKLFCGYMKVQVLNKLWFHQGKISLCVQAVSASRERYFIVTCGYWLAIHNEEKMFRDLAPDPEDHHGTRLTTSCRTAHYGANLWQLVGTEFNQLEALKTIFAANDRKIKAGFRSLLEDTLGEWRKQKQAEPSPTTLGKFYRTYFGIENCLPCREDLYQKIVHLGKECAVQRLIDNLEFRGNSLVITFSQHQIGKFNDPVPYLYDDNLLPPVNVYLRSSPGELSLDTVLYDQEAKTWLTDFGSSGLYPIWHDFAQLESVIRFKLLDTFNFPMLFYMENQLLHSRQSLDSSNQGDLEQDSRKIMNAILNIRQMAGNIAGRDPIPYAICLFYHAAAGLLSLDFSSFRKEKDTARLLYRVMLMAMLCRLFHEERPDEALVAPGDDLRFDEKNSTVSTGMKASVLTDVEIEIFKYLYSHAGTICSREDILIEGMKISQPTPEYRGNYLNTNIDRIREKIEPDPSHPRYLLTRYGKGFLLVLQPEEKTTG
jgi:DNA-binding response OmpR family regulator